MQQALKSLISLSFLGGAALYLCPEGGSRRILKLLCTAVFVLVVLAPLREIDYGALSLEEARLSGAEAEITYKSRQTEDTLKRLLLQENCEQYIYARARELGLTVRRALVELRQDDAGQWLPYTISIQAAGNEDAAERLCHLIRDELGIPAERQVWSLNG